MSLRPLKGRKKTVEGPYKAFEGPYKALKGLIRPLAGLIRPFKGLERPFVLPDPILKYRSAWNTPKIKKFKMPFKGALKAFKRPLKCLKMAIQRPLKSLNSLKVLFTKQMRNCSSLLLSPSRPGLFKPWIFRPPVAV